MTSRRPYWSSKTKKWRPYWCTKHILSELNSISMRKLSFVSVNHMVACRVRENALLLVIFNRSNQSMQIYLKYFIHLRWNFGQISRESSSSDQATGEADQFPQMESSLTLSLSLLIIFLSKENLLYRSGLFQSYKMAWLKINVHSENEPSFHNSKADIVSGVLIT